MCGCCCCFFLGFFVQYCYCYDCVPECSLGAYLYVWVFCSVTDELVIFALSVLIRVALLKRLLPDIFEHFFPLIASSIISLCLSLSLHCSLPSFSISVALSACLQMSVPVDFPCWFIILCRTTVVYLSRGERGRSGLSVSSPVGESQDHKALFVVSLLFAPGLSVNVLMLM